MIGLLQFVGKVAWFSAKARVQGNLQAYDFARSLIWQYERRLDNFRQGGALSLPQVDLFDLVGDMELCIRAKDTASEDGGTAPYETMCIVAVTRFLQPRCLFEIGTFKGARTILFARHSQRTARIFTLDLDPDEIDRMEVKPDAGDLPYINKPAIGEYIKNDPDRDKVTQLLGNSATYDFSKYHQTCDLVFVDGGHSYPFVKADTVNAFKLLKPGGMILWHDYKPECPGVVQALHEAHQERRIYHIAGTTLAVFDSSDRHAAGAGNGRA